MLHIDQRGFFEAVAHIARHHTAAEISRILTTCPVDVAAALREHIARPGYRAPRHSSTGTHRGDASFVW